jgi:capsular polysaccharide transport system ATP-binding protein
MIILEGVTKVAGGGAKKRNVLTAARARLPSDHRIAVFGSPEDKKVFIDLLGGVVLPTAGRIIRRARVGFPPGHVGGFTGTLSVRVNVAHVARLYGADVDTIVDFVAEACRLGANFNKPLAQLSSLERRHLSEILAFSIPFDVYLLNDDLVRSGAKGYSKDVSALFEARAKTSGMIIASSDPAFAREVCDVGLVLQDGQIRLFKDIEQAIKFSELSATRLARTDSERRKARRERRLQRKASDE